MLSSTEKVVTAARELGLEIEVLESEHATRTAEEAAAAIGCDVGQIVKSLLFLADDEPVMALVSGANRLNEGKLARLRNVGRKKVRRADADATRAATGFAIGGVPPFGHPNPLPVYVDEDLTRYETVWAAAGTPNTVFAISPSDLSRVTGGTVADIRIESA